jgi:2-keto-3-deoxy-L-fuconate dehydrogenase
MNQTASLLHPTTALVTGAGSGIGRAIAHRLARDGRHVWVTDLDLAAATTVQGEIHATGHHATAALADVSDLTAMQALAQRIPRLDVLVNNAGIGHIGTVETTTPADLDRLWRVNVLGVFHTTQVFMPQLLAARGVILNLCSIAAKVGLEARFAYSATKGAVAAMTVQIARDYISRGVRCNCLCPARVHTPFVDSYLAKNYPGRESEIFAQLAAAQPMGRMGTPDEVAAAASFLCSEAASFITGSSYDLDGGVIGLR